ncbi:MAG: extracellular solute-binding protein [Rubellimicrobium sp.]|nr:extracellular solute-binding protein [Rubellimicrobium sp.]
MALGLGMSASAQEADLGPITLYNGQHKDATIALIEAFTAATGVEVIERDGASPELAHQIVEEGARSPADLIYTEDASPLYMLAGAGLLAPIDPDAIAAIPAEYRDAGGLWTGVLARSRVVVYNPGLIAESDLPASIHDLVSPEWQDRFAFVPTSGAFQAQLSAMIKIDGRDAALAWLRGITETGTVYGKNSLALDAVERGEIPFALINNYYWDGMVRERGIENVASRLHFFGTHDLGEMLSVAGMGILASSTHQEAANAFIAFATGVEGQTILADMSNQYPLNPEVATPPTLKPFSELTPPSGTLDLGEFSDGAAAVELLEEAGLL